MRNSGDFFVIPGCVIGSFGSKTEKKERDWLLCLWLMSLVDVLCDLPEGKRKMVVWTSRPEKQELWEGEHEHEEELSQQMDPKYQN